MRDNFDAAISAVLKQEGGFVNDPRDAGGATNMGITRDRLARWRGVDTVSIAAVKALKVDEAKTIYLNLYWDKLDCDELPAGVDLAVLDFGVNSGPPTAARYLQTVVMETRDGIIGPKTIASVKKHEPQAVIGQLCDARLLFLKGLTSWHTFGHGWSNRIETIRVKALAMAAA